MGKATDAIADLLQRTPAGREILDAGKAEEERLEARHEARKRLDAAEAELASIPALEEDVMKAEEAYRQAMAKVETRLAKARKVHREAVQGSGHRRRRAELALRRTAPPPVSESGPIVSALLDARSHLRMHTTNEASRLREVVRDFERAGKPAGGEEAHNTAKRMLRNHDAASEMIPCVDDALERVREAQLDPEPDVADLVTALLEDVLPERCPACGESFGWRESFGGLAGRETGA